MKTSTRISLSILVLVAAIFAISLISPSASTAKAQIPSVPLAMAAASPTPAATATPSTTSEQINSVISTIQAAVNLAATLLVILLVAFILIFRTKLFRPSTNLVIETFKNSTGIADLDKVLPGLTQLTRISLIKAIGVVRNQTRAYPQYSPDSRQLPPRFPVPSGDLDQQLSDVLKSLQNIATGEVKTVAQLLSLVSPPRGTKVATTLHLLGEPGLQPGMSLEVTDLQGKQPPSIYNIQEPPPVAASKQPDSFVQKLDAVAQQLLATVEHKEPPGKDKPAEGASAGSGQPDVKALENQFIQLQAPAARWLATELAQRAWASNAPARNSNVYVAKLHNFIGSLHLSSAASFLEYDFFYSLAIQSFKQASNLIDAWYLPFENLGDTYSNWGKLLQDKDKQTQDYQQAIMYYNLALKRVAIAVPGLSDGTAETLAAVKQRIQIELILTQLYLSIHMNDQPGIQKVGKDFSDIMKGVDLYSMADSMTLYDLACCYALLYQQLSQEENKKQARCCLACCLARDIARSGEAKNDTDLHSIIEGFDALCYELAQAGVDPASIGKDFKDKIGKVLADAKWSA